MVTASWCSRSSREAPSHEAGQLDQQFLGDRVPEQVWALHDTMPDHLRPAVLLGAFAGLRLAEACGLRVNDVDFMRGVISPAVQYPAEPLKTETSRTAIPIPQTLTLELSAHVGRYGAETILTQRVRAAACASVYGGRDAADAGKVTGLAANFRYHDLRHYLASLLIAGGCDVKVVQARVRHASAKRTLDTYGHLWPDSDDSTTRGRGLAFSPIMRTLCGLAASRLGGITCEVRRAGTGLSRRSSA